MLPNFGTVFGEPIPAYFTMLMLGYGVAIYSVVRWAKRSGYDHDSMIDAGLASILGGILGGRLLHVLADGYFMDYVHLCTDPAQVAWEITKAQCKTAEGLWDAAAKVCRPSERDCLAWAKFYNGGLAYYGGLIFGSWAAIRVLKRDKQPVWKVADMTFIGVSFGLFCGRIGCFLGGCCYGLVTDHRLGLAFPAWSPASEGQFREGLLSHPGQPSLPVHPTQLYEAIGCLAIAVVLNVWGTRHKRFDGHISLMFLTLYAILRFMLEFLRADDRGLYFGVSTSQWISIVILAFAAVIYARLRPTDTASPSPGAA